MRGRFPGFFFFFISDSKKKKIIQITEFTYLFTYLFQVPVIIIFYEERQFLWIKSRAEGMIKSYIPWRIGKHDLKMTKT